MIDLSRFSRKKMPKKYLRGCGQNKTFEDVIDQTACRLIKKTINSVIAVDPRRSSGAAGPDHLTRISLSKLRWCEVTLWCAHRTSSAALIAWKLLIIDFWHRPPQHIPHLPLHWAWCHYPLFELGRAPTQKKKKKKKSPKRCLQEVWSPSSHLTDVSIRVW